MVHPIESVVNPVIARDVTVFVQQAHSLDIGLILCAVEQNGFSPND